MDILFLLFFQCLWWSNFTPEEECPGKCAEMRHGHGRMGADEQPQRRGAQCLSGRRTQRRVADEDSGWDKIPSCTSSIEKNNGSMKRNIRKNWSSRSDLTDRVLWHEPSVNDHYWILLFRRKGGDCFFGVFFCLKGVGVQCSVLVRRGEHKSGKYCAPCLCWSVLCCRF